MKRPSEMTNDTDLIAYCLTCGKEFGSVLKEHRDSRFLCPTRNPGHITCVASGPTGLTWCKVQRFILNYEVNLSPIKWFGFWGGLFRGRVGAYLLARFFVILAALLLATPFSLALNWQWYGNLILMAISLALIADVLLVTTSAAFVSRNYSVPLRSVIFTIFSFVQLVLSFSIVYYIFGYDFKDIDAIGRFQSIYFSFVTITTLGYGDISPALNAMYVQATVIAEVLVGLYFLVILVAVITNWASELPTRSPTIELKEILIVQTDNVEPANTDSDQP